MARLRRRAKRRRSSSLGHFLLELLRSAFDKTLERTRDTLSVISLSKV